MKSRMLLALIAASVLALGTASAFAQTIKIGFITSYSGLNGNLGPYMERGMRLYLKEHQKELPPGVSIEFLIRDDTGPNPDKAKQLAQELIVRDRVQFLTGVVWTPNAAAIAPLTAEAKVPFMISNAAGAAVTTLSPYVARLSVTLWQPCLPLGQWAAKNYKRAFIIVSDYAPGHDSEAAFEKGFTDAGGQMVGKLRIPLNTTDFSPFMQRAKDAKPDVLFTFVASGRTSTAFIKNFGDLGLDRAGIKLIGPGEIVPDDELPNMGDIALGVITASYYSVAGDRPANRAFLGAWRREYGERSIPPGMAVATFDAMDAIYFAIRGQAGKVDGERSMALFKTYKNPNSARGPVSIDPETRDVVQNIYIREVRRVGGELANVEFQTIPNVRDQWKELNNKK